jgi:hypothetical protein
MQSIDRVTEVQALAAPARPGRLRVDVKTERVVVRSDRCRGIVGHRGGRRHVGQERAIGSREAERSIGFPFHLEALLVHRTVVPATQHREVGERGGSSVGPVLDVMALPKRQATSRKAAATVPMLQRTP